MITEIRQSKKYRDYGEGSIYQRKDGRWVAKYKDENMLRPHYEYGKTEAEVKKKLKVYKKLAARGIVESKKVMVSTYIENWLYAFKMTAIEYGSFDRMEATFNTHIKEAFAQCQLGNIKSIEIQNMLNSKSKTLSYSSVKKIKQVFDECFAHAYIEGDIARNPMANVVIPKKSKFKDEKEMIILEDDEVKAMEAVAKMKNKQGKPLFVHANLIIFMLNTGLRRGEVMALRWKDIDFKKKVATVNKNMVRVVNRNRKPDEPKYMWLLKSTKTINGNRIVPLNSKAVEAIKNLEIAYKIYGIKHEFIARTRFDKPIGNDGFRDLLTRMLQKAKIEKPLSIHQLRHTYASRTLKAGVSISVVSQWLGHADISTTYDTYIHVFKKEKEEALQLLEKL